EVEGQETVGAGPLLVFFRHASPVDTILAPVALGNPLRLRLRYVLSRALLRDPAVDLLGQRLPNVFVDETMVDDAAETARIRDLAADLAPGEAIVLHPEGTCATPAERVRVLRALERAGDAARAA